MLKIILAALLVTTPAFAQDAVPDTLALSDEDAQTCKVKACRTITDAAYLRIAELIQREGQRADRAEAIANRLAAELAKKPNPKYCL